MSPCISKYEGVGRSGVYRGGFYGQDSWGLVCGEGGVVTGESVEAAAKKAYLAVPKSRPEVYENAMEYACKMANRFGITSVQVGGSLR